MIALARARTWLTRPAALWTQLATLALGAYVAVRALQYDNTLVALLVGLLAGYLVTSLADTVVDRIRQRREARRCTHARMGSWYFYNFGKGEARACLREDCDYVETRPVVPEATS